MPRDRTTYGFRKSDAEFLVDLIGNGVSLYPENRPRGGGGGSTPKLFVTPSGGISAATGSPPTFTVSSASCTQYQWNTTGQAVATTTTELVYNVSDQPIAGNVLIKAVMVDGRFIVDVAGCGSAGQSFLDWRV